MKKLFFILIIFLATNAFSQLTKVDSFINKWIGKPYHYGGTTERGIDCSAFVQKFYEVVYGKIISRTCYYQFANATLIAFNDLKIGDVLFFRSKTSPSGWHAGVYIGNDEFIHAANYRDGVKISCIYNPIYFDNIKGIGRF